MKKISILLLFLMFLSQSEAQWVSHYGINPQFDVDLTNSKGLAVTVDNWGNCYVTGYTNIPGNGNDIFVVKYSPSGDTAWTRSYNGTDNSDDQGNAIAVDNYGNVYVAGTAKIVGKSNEMVLLKYNCNGNLLWGGLPKLFGETDYAKEDVAVGLAIDYYGNIYVTGYTTGLDGRNNLVLIKYDSYGNKKWNRQEDGSEDLDTRGTSITVDYWGNILLTGYTTSTLGGSDIIVCKYNGGGNLSWSYSFNGSGSGEDKAFGIVTDDNCNIYVTGYATINSETGNTDCITLKYSSSGILLWQRAFGEGSEDKAFGIVVDNVNNIYITGYATTSESSKNYVTIKYNTEGTLQWSSIYNGTGNGDDIARAIGLLSDGNIVVTGGSWGSNNNDDYATVKYDAVSGTELQACRYSLNGISEDVANDIASSPGGEVYITGYSELLINGPIASSEITTQMLPWGNNQEMNTNNNHPKKFTLSQNYPNPFNPSTTIKFEISSPADVKLTVYDMLGKVVDVLVNQKLEAGSYSIGYTNRGLSSGIYFYELKADSFRDIKKMTLVK